MRLTTEQFRRLPLVIECSRTVQPDGDPGYPPWVDVKAAPLQPRAGALLAVMWPGRCEQSTAVRMEPDYEGDGYTPGTFTALVDEAGDVVYLVHDSLGVLRLRDGAAVRPI